jgi:fatty acid desaturase
MKSANANSAGSFSTLLSLLFIALKLTGHITWSWWWVLSPIWIPIVVTVLLFGVWVVAVYIKKKKQTKGYCENDNLN